MGRFKWSKLDAMAALGLAEHESDNLVRPIEDDEADTDNIRLGREEEEDAEFVPPLEDQESDQVGRDMYNDVFAGDQDGVLIPIMDDA